MFGYDDSPAALDNELRRAGMRPAAQLHTATVDPDDVSLSEWNRLGVDEDRAAGYAVLETEPPRVLLVPDDTGYEVVDGAHRVEAARRSEERVPAVVLTSRAYEELYNFGDGAMHRWAHSHL